MVYCICYSVLNCVQINTMIRRGRGVSNHCSSISSTFMCFFHSERGCVVHVFGAECVAMRVSAMNKASLCGPAGATCLLPIATRRAMNIQNHTQETWRWKKMKITYTTVWLNWKLFYPLSAKQHIYMIYIFVCEGVCVSIILFICT